MYGPPLRTLLVSIACERPEFLLSAVPPELGRTLVRTTAQRRKWLPVRQSLDAPPRARDEWRGQRCPSVGCAFVAPRTAEGAGEWALADEGSVPVLRFCSRRATLGRRIPSMDSIGSYRSPHHSQQTPPWPGADVAWAGPCLAPRRDLHSALQLEPFELRPIGGSTHRPSSPQPGTCHSMPGWVPRRMYRIVRDRHIIPSYPSTPQRCQTTFSAAARTGRVIDLAFVHLDHDDADSPALARLSRDVAANRPTDATRPEEVDVFARVLLRSGRMMISYGCVRTRA